MSAIHHLRICVSDFERSMKFYTPILSWLGFEKIRLIHREELPRAGFKKDGLVFLISQAKTKRKHVHGAVGLHHIAFAVDSREKVDRFFNEVLLKMDSVEIEDPPVDCPEYGEGYYATFFFDPDDVKLEVVYFKRRQNRRFAKIV